MPFIPDVIARTKELTLPDPDPGWVRRCMSADLTLEETVAAHAHRIGHPHPAPTRHVLFPDQRDADTVTLECCCGSYTIARGFSRDERDGWWQSHLAAVRSNADPDSHR